MVFTRSASTRMRKTKQPEIEPYVPPSEQTSQQSDDQGDTTTVADTDNPIPIHEKIVSCTTTQPPVVRHKNVLFIVCIIACICCATARWHRPVHVKCDLVTLANVIEKRSNDNSTTTLVDTCTTLSKPSQSLFRQVDSIFLYQMHIKVLKLLKRTADERILTVSIKTYPEIWDAHELLVIFFDKLLQHLVDCQHSVSSSIPYINIYLDIAECNVNDPDLESLQYDVIIDWYTSVTDETYTLENDVDTNVTCLSAVDTVLNAYLKATTNADSVAANFDVQPFLPLLSVCKQGRSCMGTVFDDSNYM
jgi:hypothetical protein